MVIIIIIIIIIFTYTPVVNGIKNNLKAKRWSG